LYGGEPWNQQQLLFGHVARLAGTWPDTVLCFATGPKDPICWYIVSKAGNMTEQQLLLYRIPWGEQT